MTKAAGTLGLAVSLTMFSPARSILAVEPSHILALWPGEVPNETSQIAEERDTTKPTDNLIAGKPVIRLGNVSRPTIAVYRPSKEIETGTSILVCPGGGYHILAMDLEGTEVCEWLNSSGVTAVLLKYRVPRRPGREKHAAPLQDAERAMGLIRQHATEWNLDPARVGALGFSAGGHLAAALARNPWGRSYPRVDAADDLKARPDFTVLIYPGYLTLKDDGDRIADDVAVGPDNPPTLLVMTQDDGVRVENVVHYFLALKRAGVPSELHVYPSGGHGYGLRRSAEVVTSWPDRARDWMRSRGLLEKK